MVNWNKAYEKLVNEKKLKKAESFELMNGQCKKYKSLCTKIKASESFVTLGF